MEGCCQVNEEPINKIKHTPHHTQLIKNSPPFKRLLHRIVVQHQTHVHQAVVGGVESGAVDVGAAVHLGFGVEGLVFYFLVEEALIPVVYFEDCVVFFHVDVHADVIQVIHIEYLLHRDVFSLHPILWIRQELIRIKSLHYQVILEI